MIDNTFNFVGQLLDHIQNRIKFTEKEASYVIKDLASALQFLHKKGKYYDSDATLMKDHLMIFF